MKAVGDAMGGAGVLGVGGAENETTYIPFIPVVANGAGRLSKTPV